MSANESLMPTSEDGKTSQAYNIETGQVKFTKVYIYREHLLHYLIFRAPIMWMWMHRRNSLGWPRNNWSNTETTHSGSLFGKNFLNLRQNEPFSYALFILFWLTWLLMFVGAILIVVLSPKCAAKEVTKWSKVAVAYQVYWFFFLSFFGNSLGLYSHFLWC